MHSPGINREEFRGKPTNPGSPGKMAIKTECVCVCVQCKQHNSHQYSITTVYIFCTASERHGQLLS